MLKCPSCGTNVSFGASDCQRCGHPLKLAQGEPIPRTLSSQVLKRTFQFPVLAMLVLHIPFLQFLPGFLAAPLTWLFPTFPSETDVCGAFVYAYPCSKRAWLYLFTYYSVVGAVLGALDYGIRGAQD
jgi:prepilin signal peptidase PulO-like enzyme (type II secretory pathway)